MENGIIKFRAWDEDRKIMVYDFKTRLTTTSYTLFWSEDDKKLYCGNYMNNGDWQEPKLMQLVATPFVFGKRAELYVGDIVNYDTEDGQVRAEVVIIERSDDEDKWISGFAYKFICYEEEQRLDGLGESFDFNIIGNIYENPDLLISEK